MANLKTRFKNYKKNKENKEEKIEILVKEGGVIEFKVRGNLNEQFIKKMEDRVVEEFEIAKKLPGKVKILANMEELDIDPRTGWRSTVGIRKLAVKFLTWEKLEKAAVLINSKNAFLKVAALFVFRLTGAEKAKLFFNKEEAEKWLKQ